MSISSPTVSLPPNDFIGSTEFILNVTSIDGWRGDINFTTSPLPDGITISNLPYNYSLTTPHASWIIGVTIGASPAAGDYAVIITATSGSLIHSASVTVQVARSAVPEFPSAAAVILLSCLALTLILKRSRSAKNRQRL
ncbi:MAG TPA: hypothetical protein VEC43_00785 [Candidatus Acidoferrales bacterium]|nr:hypothetical protein [Candidatus Acidoferrales bacterium]